MSLRTAVPGRALLALALLLTLTLAAVAQENTPKGDVFAGYSWLEPGRLTVNGDKHGAHGWGAAASVYANRWFGLTADASGHYDGDRFHDFRLAAGPKFTLRGENVNLFGEALAGWSRMTLKPVDLSFNAPTFLGGGGLDLIFGKWFVRPIQADYVYAHYEHTDFGMGTQKGVRLQAGLGYMFGGAPPVPVAASCSVQPTSVMAGEPVTATVQPSNVNPKHTPTFAWSGSNGVKVEGNQQTAKIDTTGLAPGQYTVSATVTDPKQKKNNVATCNSAFTIQEPPKHPPTISCTVDKATVRSGDPATVTCNCTSPDNRPVTYAWTSTAGRVGGNAATSTLDTAGAPAGPITVTTTCSDDRQLTAQATTSVTVEVPPPPPTASKLNEIAFPNKQKPWRVDNTAKAILDDVALRLQREADAKAVVVGYVDPGEKGGEKLAQQRAVNTKAYLTQEKGIDPSRIDVRTGTAGGTRAEIYLVPAGATFNVEGTQTFDEAKVKPVTDKRAAPRKKARR